MSWILCGFIAFIDQFIKWLVERKMYNKEINVIENIFSFTYVQNRGAAWGFLSDYGFLLNIIILCMLTVIIIYSIKVKGSEKIFCMVVLGGALGNFIDRIFRGYVVDYIDFKVWPVFNFADVCIVIGCILFCINLFIKEKKYGD